MDLKREIELLKEKLALLEKIKDLQDAIKMKECTPIVPYIPPNSWPGYPYPAPYPWYREYSITWSPNTGILPNLEASYGGS